MPHPVFKIKKNYLAFVIMNYDKHKNENNFKFENTSALQRINLVIVMLEAKCYFFSIVNLPTLYVGELCA